MTYSELQNLAYDKKITLQTIADIIGMSRVGMKTSFENQTLPIKKVNILCERLNITPNQFFGWKEDATHRMIQNGGVLNTQTMNIESMQVLKEQLRIKDEQLKEKDTQISMKDKQINNLISRLK